MRRVAGLVVVWTAVAFPQSTLLPPRLGYLRDGNNSLRQVLGVRANFVLGSPAAEGAISAAFSGRSGLVKTEGAILVLNDAGQLVARYAAPAGPALFAFSAHGMPELAYLLETHELLRWNDGRPLPVSWNSWQLEGEILALAYSEDDCFSMVVERHGGAWRLTFSAQSGELQSQVFLPGVRAPVLLRGDGTLVFADGEELVVRAIGGGERRFPIPSGVAGMEQFGDAWLQVVSRLDGVRWALGFTEDGASLYALPGAR
jgi:hypothetical protein